MEQVIEFLQTLIRSYGFYGCVTVVLTAIFSQLAKYPLKQLAVKWAEKNNKDKTVITRWFVALPLVVGAVLTFVFYSWRYLHWDMDAFSVSDYVSQTSVFSSLSVALYEVVDNFIKSFQNNTDSKASTKAIDVLNDKYKLTIKEENGEYILHSNFGSVKVSAEEYQKLKGVIDNG